MSGRAKKGSGSALHAARRRWLAQAGALVSAAALPFRIPLAAAQSQSTLNALPRHALVIGNTNYLEAPLKNPGNDARAIAGELQKLGFQLSLKLDAGRNEMIDAIRAFGSELGKRKTMGLFYYAGHGAQLAWRNYLIPVDAEIEKLEDMQTRAVELSMLLEGLIKAQNPMNVIILDACRDNPFGNKAQIAQKGLSQFDAPPGSLLAYATAPGNVAADGEGGNGLYTENLLRELKTPDAKIEDVFKRVRLNVRLKSGGRQIPWESTSLEDDFYFLPPQQVKKLSEAELKKQFDEEFAIWERIKEAKDPAPVEDYIRKYPSGKFSELAQFRLDRLLLEKEKMVAQANETAKPVQPVSNAGNPFSKGTARADTKFKLGDSYSYRVLDLYTKLETARYEEVVTAITDIEVVFSDRARVTDLLGNTLQDREGRRTSGVQGLIAEYSVGKKWTTRFVSIGPQGSGAPAEVEIDLKVVARETVTVPAGTFDAYKVEGHGWVIHGGVNIQIVYWIAPDKSRRPIVVEMRRRHQSGKVLTADRTEITAFNQGG